MTNGDLTIKEVDYHEYYDIIKEVNQAIYHEELNFINKEYTEDKYDEYSVHYLTMFNNDYIGYSRIVKPNPHGFPAFEIAEITTDIDLNKSVEASRVMVRKDFRKNSAKIGLFAVSNTAKYIIDNRFHNSIVDVFVDSDNSIAYDLCKKFGYKEISKQYQDTRYSYKKLSVVMALNYPEIINVYRLYQYMIRNILTDADIDNYMVDYMCYKKQ